MIEPDGFLARFQSFEYALAFRVGRASLANYSITSGVSIYRRDALESALAEHSMSVYAEDYENAMILLSRGETIYYDGRLVVSTEGPGRLTRWFSQRVGWYHGLLRVYWTRFGEVWQVSKRSPFAFYHFIVYVGVLSLGLHLAKMVSADAAADQPVQRLRSAAASSHVLPESSLTNPGYFVSAIGSYLALGVVALFTVVPKAERAYAAPIVPLYLFYALVHIVPMTVGFVNWVTLQFIGRRVYRDHYESDANLRARRRASRTAAGESRMTIRGTPAPALLSACHVLGGPRAPVRERRAGARRGVLVRHARALQPRDRLVPVARAAPLVACEARARRCSMSAAASVAGAAGWRRAART